MASSSSNKFVISETVKIQNCYHQGEKYQTKLITAEEEQSRAKVALEASRAKVKFHHEEWQKALQETNVESEKYLIAVNTTADIRHKLKERQIQLRNLLEQYTERIRVFDETKDSEYTHETLHELKRQTQKFLSELGVFPWLLMYTLILALI